MDDALLRMDAAWFTLFGKLTSGQTAPQELSDAVAAVEEQRLAVNLPPLESLGTSGFFLTSASVQWNAGFELFTGKCPYCGGDMKRVDSGYDHELSLPYTHFICLACCDKASCPEVDIHVDSKTGEVLRRNGHR